MTDARVMQPSDEDPGQKPDRSRGRIDRDEADDANQEPSPKEVSPARAEFEWHVEPIEFAFLGSLQS